MTTPRRRWSFTLRTLFVVVGIVACGLGWFSWQAMIVHERQLVLSRMSHCGGPPDGPSTGLPWAWRMLGDKGVIDLDTGSVTTKAELDRLHWLFPETVNVQDQWKYLRGDLD